MLNLEGGESNSALYYEMCETDDEGQIPHKFQKKSVHRHSLSKEEGDGYADTDTLCHTR